MKSEFSKLAEDLETLAKSQGEMTEEQKIAAAAAAAGHVEPDGDEGAAAASGDNDGDEGAAGTDSLEGAAAGADNGNNGDEGDDVLGKSFDVMTAGGEKVKAYDATALLKSLSERMETIEGSIATNEEDRESIAKSLSSIADLLKSNANEIETLKKSLADMGDQGRGRKAVLTVMEKPQVGTMAKSEGASGAMGRKEFMAKADEAMKAGRISGGELSLAETYLNRGGAVPEEIVSRVMGNQ